MKSFGLIFPMLLSIQFAIANSESAYEEFDNPVTETNVVDQQKGEEYIHQGLATKRTNEMCSDGRNGYKDICDEEKYGFKDGSMRKLEALVPALTTAYSMFNTMANLQGGGGLTATKMKDGNPVMKDGEPETESKPDYCGYIGMIGEAANTAYTALQNDKTENNYKKEKPEARQAASFYAVAESHKTMEKGAKVQMGVWGATGACYVAYATQAAYQGDWKVYAKMGAAAFITMYYKKKADAHAERQKLLKQMAKELPQAGECNPFTAANCFCAEETSAASDPINFRNICLPQEIAARSADGKEAFVCADQSGKADPTCECEKTNTCVDRRLKVAGVNLGLGPTTLKDPLSALKPLSKGFSDGSVDRANRNNQALVKKALKNFKPTSIPNLNNKQKKIANDLFKNGIPKAAAAYMAKGLGGSSKGSIPSGALAGLNGSPLKARTNGKNSIVINNGGNKFKSGGTLRGKKSRSNAFGKFGKKRSRSNKGSAIEIEGFAKKAEREAEIVKDTSKGIFDIISYRYKMSAWREFKDSFKPEEKK